MKYTRAVFNRGDGRSMFELYSTSTNPKDIQFTIQEKQQILPFEKQKPLKLCVFTLHLSRV